MLTTLSSLFYIQLMKDVWLTNKFSEVTSLPANLTMAQLP